MDNPETEALLPPKDKRPGSPLSNQSTDSDSDSSLKQSEPSLLSKLDLIDKNLSEPIYNLETNCLCEFLIYTCARLFNPDLMVSYFILMFAYHAIVYKDYFFIIKPLLHVITMLIITLITKHLIGRPRPQPRDSVKRRFNCRSKETNADTFCYVFTCFLFLSLCLRYCSRNSHWTWSIMCDVLYTQSVLV